MDVACREARFVVGAALTGKEAAGRPNGGEVRSIDRIVYTPLSRTVGFLYTVDDRRLFVSDRESAQLTTRDLAIMNQLTQAMGAFKGNAFDPRDNGYVYYRVKWDRALANKMHLVLRRCDSTPHNK